ncbi:hypothetical protein IQ238_19075 [Pleurocapsales cyanobacterium LEGE 06147]|nr:hypothetical protein [Pleurocapsales cyanobacterium LEGE 06147]
MPYYIFDCGRDGDRVNFYVLLMAILAQLVAHTSFNWALRWIVSYFCNS